LGLAAAAASASLAGAGGADGLADLVGLLGLLGLLDLVFVAGSMLGFFINVTEFRNILQRFHSPCK
jgi:hypothetical protein